MPIKEKLYLALGSFFVASLYKDDGPGFFKRFKKAYRRGLNAYMSNYVTERMNKNGLIKTPQKPFEFKIGDNVTYYNHGFGRQESGVVFFVYRTSEFGSPIYTIQKKDKSEVLVFEQYLKLVEPKPPSYE